MAIPGLVAALNLGDVVDRERVWDNLCSGMTASSPSGTVTFTIKGADVLALEGASNASTRDFVLIKGLSSVAQPRITAAAFAAASGVALEANALPKASPSSVGNYALSRGALDGGLLKVNGLGVASLSSSPFSGGTATTSLSISYFSAPLNFRFTQAMTAGTIANPERAIPFESSLLILYAKAGQT